MSARSIDRRLVVGSASQGLPGPRLELLAESDDGDAVVYGWYETPTGEVCVRGLATFRFSADSDLVEARPDPGVLPESVAHSFYTTALPLIGWACDGIEAFHASGVRFASGVVALAGPSESGKTTLAHALAARGHAHFAEDVVAFHTQPDGVWATPLPYTVNLRPASSDYFVRSRAPVPTPSEVHAPFGEDVPLAAVIVLEPSADGPARPALERLSPPDALLALLPNAHRFKSQPADRERRMLETYLALVSHVPAFRLSYAQEFESLPDVLACLEQAGAG